MLLCSSRADYEKGETKSVAVFTVEEQLRTQGPRLTARSQGKTNLGFALEKTQSLEPEGCFKSQLLQLQSALRIHRWFLNLQIQPTSDGKYLEKRNSRKGQKAKFEFAMH